MTKIWIKALLASRHLLLTTLHLIFHFFTTIPCLRQHFYPLDILVTNTRKFDHITPFLQELRWLPVRYYLMYTVGVLTFKCVKGIAPSYLTDRFVTRSTVHDRNTRNTRCGGRGWIKHQHLPFSVPVCSSLAHFLRQVQWWSVAMVTRYHAISIRWSSHV